MALEFMDGFDHYNSGTNYARKWDTTSTGMGPVAGRFGGTAANTQNNPATLIQGQLASVATRVVGFAFQIFPSIATNPWLQLTDAGTTQLDLRLTATAQIQVTRNGTVLGTSTLTLTTGIWYYLEFKATIDPTAGSYEVRVNGANWVSGTGANTRNTTNSSMNGIKFPNAGFPTIIDDLYILNTSGSANNNFLGECRILTNLPTGDGASTTWTTSTGTSHFALVDEANPNDDTDYNYSNTSGQIDLYTYASIANTGTIAAVQTVLTARKDDIGTRQIAEQCRSGGTTYTGPTTQTLGSAYLMYREIRETDPATGAAWTTTGVNAAQFGVKVV